MLEHTDTFRLTLSAFDQTFHLHLRPNEHLVHPAARITYLSTTHDGRTVSHTEPLLRQNVKAYWGEVVNPENSQARLREDAAGVHPRPSGGNSELGWARITVYDQGDIGSGRPPSFEGAFSVNGDVHHVMPTANYIRNKHALDPHVLIDATPEAGLVVFRDSDVMSLHEYAGESARTCAHDQMDWNVNPLANPVLRKPAPSSPWYNPFGILYPQVRGNHSLARRDDVAGGNMGSKSVYPSLPRGAPVDKSLASRATLVRPQGVLRPRRSSTWALRLTACTQAPTARHRTLRSRSSQTSTRRVPCTNQHLTCR